MFEATRKELFERTLSEIDNLLGDYIDKAIEDAWSKPVEHLLVEKPKKHWFIYTKIHGWIAATSEHAKMCERRLGCPIEYTAW